MDVEGSSCITAKLKRFVLHTVSFSIIGFIFGYRASTVTPGLRSFRTSPVCSKVKSQGNKKKLIVWEPARQIIQVLFSPVNAVSSSLMALPSPSPNWLLAAAPPAPVHS